MFTVGATGAWWDRLSRDGTKVANQLPEELVPRYDAMERPYNTPRPRLEAAQYKAEATQYNLETAQ